MKTIDTEKKILRRMSLLYIEGTMRENLLTIVEQIEPDMPDYTFSPKDTIACHEGSFLIDVEDYDVADGWQEDIKQLCEWIGVNNGDDYQREPKDLNHLVLSREFDKTQLTEILPFRKGPYYVVCYQCQNNKTKELLGNEELKQNISAITEKYLGYDLCSYEKWVGGIYMVWHHPYIKDIHFTGTDNPAGMLCTIITRKPISLPLTFIVTDHDKEGNQIGNPIEKIVDTAIGRFLLNTNKPVTRPDVDVRDGNGELVFSIKGIIFIKKIVLNMGIVDGITGKKEAVMERDVISSEIKPDKDQSGQKREDLTRRILEQLSPLPQEEREIIIDEVKRRLERNA